MAPLKLSAGTETSVIPDVPFCARGVRIASTFDRSFQLDAVAFRIVKIDGRPASLRAVARCFVAARDAVRGEMLRNCRGVERLDAQAQVIEIGAAGARGAFRRSFLVRGH